MYPSHVYKSKVMTVKITNMNIMNFVLQVAIVIKWGGGGIKREEAFTWPICPSN